MSTGEGAEPAIVETTRAAYERDVLERSRRVPVVVDFWAEWCGPCRLLGPILEGLAREHAGRFALVKVDVDALPEVAGEFGVQSIPAVFAVRDGRVVDGFVGVQGEPALRAFLGRLLPSPAEERAIAGEGLEAADSAAAEAEYRTALALEPDLPRAAIGLARVHLAAGREAEARALIEALERRGYLESEAERIKAELTLRAQAEAAGPLDAARAAASARPDDLPARLALAEALAAAGEHAEALELALDLVERDRRGVGEAARKLMLAVFGILPPDSELVADFRRRLSLAL